MSMTGTLADSIGDAYPAVRRCRSIGATHSTWPVSGRGHLVATGSGTVTDSSTTATFTVKQTPSPTPSGQPDGQSRADREQRRDATPSWSGPTTTAAARLSWRHAGRRRDQRPAHDNGARRDYGATFDLAGFARRWPRSPARARSPTAARRPPSPSQRAGGRLRAASTGSLAVQDRGRDPHPLSGSGNIYSGATTVSAGTLAEARSTPAHLVRRCWSLLGPPWTWPASPRRSTLVSTGKVTSSARRHLHAQQRRRRRPSGAR